MFALFAFLLEKDRDEKKEEHPVVEAVEKLDALDNFSRATGTVPVAVGMVEG